MSTVVISSDEDGDFCTPKKRAKLMKVSSESDSSLDKKCSEDNKENNGSVQCIDSSDDDTEQQSSTTVGQNHLSPAESHTEEKFEPLSSTSKGVDFFKNQPGIGELLSVCIEKITDDQQKDLFISKVNFLMKYYKQVGKEYIESDDFKDMLKDYLAKAENGDLVIALNSFIQLTRHLKSVAQESPKETPNSHSIKKLEKFLNKLRKRITELEEQDVDFELDDNSVYIQMQKYRERAVKVYSKICQYRKENPYSESITHRRLDFSDSNYIEINKAINKKFKTGEIFPTYFDVEKCIRKCVSNKKMDISEGELTAEARHCFEKLGNLLQNRRRHDLHDVHSQYLPLHLDPARDNPELNARLNANRNLAKQAINSICEKYVRLQEEGKDMATVSSDSEDSNYNDSPEEDSD